MTDKDKECRSQREAIAEVLNAIADSEYDLESYEVGFQAGAAWQQSRLLDDELAENAVKAARQEWYARTSASLMCFENFDTEPAGWQECYTLHPSHMTALARKTFDEFLSSVRHGAKFIDIHVRKDGKEYNFQADALKYMRPPPAPSPEQKGHPND